MRIFYTCITLMALLFVTGCSKDFLKSYDRRIVGTWRIADIDRYGFSGSDNLPFNENGRLTFSDDGQVTYEYEGVVFRGSWDIIRHRRNDDALDYALQLTVIDFSGQRVLSEYFNDMQFTGTDRFTAFIEYGTRTYVYRFKR